MQHFRDTETGAVLSFEDDVLVETLPGGGFQFFAFGANEPLSGPYPTTLVRTNDPTPPPFVPSLEVLAKERDTLLGIAAVRIAPLQDAVDLRVATEDEQSRLIAWKTYRVALGRLDLTVAPVEWPEAPNA